MATAQTDQTAANAIRAAARRIAEQLGQDFDQAPTIGFGKAFTQDDFLRAARFALAEVAAKAEADVARARLSLVMAMGALNTALGDTEADLKKPERARVLRRRIDEISATIASLDRK